MLIQPLPFEEPDELVNVSHTAPGLGYDQIPLAPDTYLLVREESDVYDKLAVTVAGDLLTDIYLDTRRTLELIRQRSRSINSVRFETFCQKLQATSADQT